MSLHLTNGCWSKSLLVVENLFIDEFYFIIFLVGQAYFAIFMAFMAGLIPC